jgi:hypothetical protein
MTVTLRKELFIMAKKGLALSLLAGLGIAIAAAQPGFAQNSADLLKDPNQGDSLNNLFNNRGDGSNSAIFDLIQRISNPTLDPAAFRQQQRENLNSAAAEFRAKQRQLLQQQGQPQVAPVTPVQPKP